MNYELLEIEKYRRLRIPKELDLGGCWKLMKPVVASEVGANIYTPVPYLTETSVYKVGYIFVKVQNNATGCCGGMQKAYKILGPLNKYVNKSYTTSDWCVPQLPTIKTTTDFLDFKVRIRHGDNEAFFRGYDYHQLRLSELMRPIENLQLNRNSHQDLGNADRFGLINSVAATKKFEFRITTKNSSRIFLVGDGNYTILFGHQMCSIDRTGVVVAVSDGRPSRSMWLSLKPRTASDLPLWEPEGSSN